MHNNNARDVISSIVASIQTQHPMPLWQYLILIMPHSLQYCQHFTSLPAAAPYKTMYVCVCFQKKTSSGDI